MQIGPWWVPLYTLRITLGTLSGLCWLGITSNSERLLRFSPVARCSLLTTLITKLNRINKAHRSVWSSPRMTLELLWATSIAALTMGRWGYVVGNWPYFAQNPTAILQLRQVGGLHSGSAWMGGLLAVGLWACSKRLWVADVIARLSPIVLLTAAGAWWGCADVGCAWGREALNVGQGLPTVTWHRIITVEAPDIYHTVLPRYAVQNLGMVWALVMALSTMMVPRWGALAVAGYLLGEAALTQIRGDPVLTLGPYRVDLLLNLGLSLAIWLMQWHSWHTRRRLSHKI
jgi:prolipoprotein diacylglyceryltransferase